MHTASLRNIGLLWAMAFAALLNSVIALSFAAAADKPPRAVSAATPTGTPGETPRQQRHARRDGARKPAAHP